MQQFSVRIMLPIEETYQKEDLKKTLDSIEQQTFGKENIELISVLYMHDPELMKYLLEYPLPHHAVYEKKTKRRSMIYHEVGAISQSTWRKDVMYSLKMQVGDVLCRDMLSICVKTMQEKHTEGLICEAEIADHSIIQKSLFTQSRTLEPKDMTEYLIRGPLHRVFYFERGVNMIGIPNNEGQVFYDPHSWNFKFTNGGGKEFYYLNNALGTTVRAEKWFDVSFAKLLAYYSALIGYIRKYEENANLGIKANEQELFCKNLAHIAIGMACVSELKGDEAAAEDFLLFAKMVNRTCENESVYRETKENLIIKNEKTALETLQKIMNDEE